MVSSLLNTLSQKRKINIEGLKGLTKKRFLKIMEVLGTWLETEQKSTDS